MTKSRMVDVEALQPGGAVSARARAQHVDKVTGETVATPDQGTEPTGDYLATFRIHGTRGRFRDITIPIAADEVVGEAEYKIATDDYELQQRARDVESKHKASERERKKRARIRAKRKGKQEIPGVRATFRTAADAASKFMAENEGFFDAAAASDPVDNIRDYLSSQRRADTDEGRWVIEQAGKGRSLGAIHTLLQDIFQQAHRKRWDAVPWGTVEELIEHLEEAIERGGLMERGTRQGSGREAHWTAAPEWWPPASGVVSPADAIAVYGPELAAKLAGPKNRETFEAALSAAEKAYAEGAACLSESEQRIAQRRLRTLTKAGDREDDELPELRLCDSKGGPNQCTWRTLTAMARQLAAACGAGRVPAWPALEEPTDEDRPREPSPFAPWENPEQLAMFERQFSIEDKPPPKKPKKPKAKKKAKKKAAKKKAAKKKPAKRRKLPAERVKDIKKREREAAALRRPAPLVWELEQDEDDPEHFYYAMPHNLGGDYLGGEYLLLWSVTDGGYLTGFRRGDTTDMVGEGLYETAPPAKRAAELDWTKRGKGAHMPSRPMMDPKAPGTKPKKNPSSTRSTRAPSLQKLATAPMTELANTRVLELIVRGGDGKERAYTMRSPYPSLYWSQELRTLWFVVGGKRGRIRDGAPREAGAAAASERWTGRGARTHRLVELPAKQLHKLGTAVRIVYRMGKAAAGRAAGDYHHDLDPGTGVWAQKGAGACAFLLRGRRLKVTARGLVH